MEQRMDKDILFMLKQKKRRKFWSRALSVMMCVVVFCTTYALILPAITKETDTFCGIEAHTHTEDCYDQTLLCESHVHDEACFEMHSEQICGLEETEGHTHGETCVLQMEKVLNCELEETEGHTHTEACGVTEQVLSCGLEETAGHTHTEACTSKILTCSLPEDEAHTHSDSCYTTEYICGLEEGTGHSHTEDCYTSKTVYVCGMEEHAGHQHGDTCWTEVAVYSCGLQETEPHVHTEACFETTQVQICTIETDPEHEHTESCYDKQLICELEEHAHSLPCYADPNADLETAEIWEASLPTELSGVYAEDVLAIAKSQLGYTESVRNYQVSEDGETKGYTRYGAWYGIPYGDWCAMFVSFCLDYAGVEEFPLDANCPNWINNLKEKNMYAEAEGCIPNPGDIIFFDWNENGLADHVGLVEEYIPATEQSAGKIQTIEGNSGNTVRYNTYNLTDTTIMGYGMLPAQLSAEEQNRVNKVISLIDAMPSADEIDVKVEAFAAAEDEDGEIAWLEQVYQQVAEAYYYYDQLPEMLRSHVSNADKLLELEYIWSVTTFVNDEIARTVAYSEDLFEQSNRLVVYMQSGDAYYAFDGNGDAVKIEIADDGTITADIDDPTTLYWSFTASDSDYHIKNEATGQYMYATYQNGVISQTASASSVVTSGNGVKIKSGSYYANLNAAKTEFTRTNASGAAVFYFGRAKNIGSIRLDGTNGTLMAFTNSSDVRVEGDWQEGDIYTLPTTWDSPSKYEYKLNGWYDITTGTYYQPGDELVVQSDHILYADWMAGTYDVGFYNEHTVDSMDTNEFITTHVFDYSSIFNMYSCTYTGTIVEDNHTEAWDFIRLTQEEMNSTQYGSDADVNDVPVHGNHSMGFIFRDWDNGGDLVYPADANEDWNVSTTGNTNVTKGILNSTIGASVWDKLFFPGNTDSTGQEVLGKKYVGQGNYLYQYMEDGMENYDGVHNGYFYYDSTKNAASYNQTDARFYVYDYLERTSDSLKDGCNSDGSLKTAGGHSDFLPFNSPYANTNGQKQVNYSVDENDQINYQYDAKYDGERSEAGNIGTNYWFGFSSTVEFYLPNDVGYQDAEGNFGNKSTHGQDMTFHFSGDDDVWVFIDGNLILDLGGMHDIVTGEINFSTGVVTNAGTTSTLDLGAGSHQLTICYMERGASQANCRIYFNIAPRYTMTIQKEDYLNKHLLDGAQFSVFMDVECTVPAELWTSKEAYNDNGPTTNVFTVANGEAKLWGFSAGHVYYIKETKAPILDADGDGVNDYNVPDGLIKVTLNSFGDTDYDVLTMVEDVNGNGPSPGFTAYGFRVDPETEQAFLVITNGTGLENMTDIMVRKVWNGGTERPDVPVYLLADGIQIRDAVLNESNGWQHLWQNLPKAYTNGTPIQYTVQEGLVPGYVGKVEQVEEYEVPTTTWTGATGFTNGKTYLLKTASGYLATESESSSALQWITDEATAEASATAQWTASSVSGNNVTLTNKAGQTLYYLNQNSNHSYGAAESPPNGSKTSLRFYDNKLSYGTSNYSRRYLNSSLGTTAYSSYAVEFALYAGDTTTETIEVEGIGFQITNTPVSETTDLTVNKVWMYGTDPADPSLYQTLSVPVKLLANGSETGQTATLSLRSDWEASFTGLPARDADGNPITYTVEEALDSEIWKASYDYSGTNATITNSYQLTIPVEKIWDASVTTIPEDITLELYTAPDDGQAATKVDTITLTAANGWKGSFEVSIPQMDQNYYVYEPQNGYQASYSNPGQIYIDGAPRKAAKVTFGGNLQSQPVTVTVTNRTQYEMPETGGTGTYLYTTAGLLLMLTSTGYLLYNHKKRRREIF